MVKDLYEYIQCVNDIIQKDDGFRTTSLPWFRGQSQESWDLIPSLYRNKGTGKYERELVRDFILLSENNSQHTYCIETLIHMQHYGIPTRLIDWTESHLFALYFAIRSYKNFENSAVYIFYPWDLNEMTLPYINGFKKGSYTIPTSYDSRLQDYLINIEAVQRKVQIQYPIAIRPKRTNQRIRAQKGMFTLHGNDNRSLDEIISSLNKRYGTEGILYKIVIDGKQKLHLLKQLYASGVTHSNMFPEQEGICKDISFRYSKDFTGFPDAHDFTGF